MSQAAAPLRAVRRKRRQVPGVLLRPAQAKALITEHLQWLENENQKATTLDVKNSPLGQYLQNIKRKRRRGRGFL